MGSYDKVTDIAERPEIVSRVAESGRLPRSDNSCNSPEFAFARLFFPWPPTVTPEQDVKKCLDALDEIGALQVTTQHLQKHGELIATLKKVKPAKQHKKWQTLTSVQCRDKLCEDAKT